MTCRNWCFTYNNPTENSDEIIELFQASGACRYLIFQKEKGESGTEHYQGYSEFTKPYRIAGLKKILKTAHWESRRGTREQARDYCCKEDSKVEGPWEYGDFGQHRGKRTDIESLYREARTAKTLLEVAEACPGSYMRYYKAVQHVRQLEAFSKPSRGPADPMEVILFYGPPGTGKTRRAYEEAPGLWAIPLGKSLWFDNYCGEPDVLIDDFSGNLPLVDALRMLDRYPIQVPVKGAFVYWRPARIFITTNVHPRNWYDYSSREDSFRALTRRFTKVIQFSDDSDPKEYVGESLSEFF